MPPGKDPGFSLPMPQTDLYDPRTVQRDALVARYGDATVLRAEMATMMNIMFHIGAVKRHEFMEMMLMQLHRVDAERRGQANLEEDRG